ncbi:ferredoxin [Streptomyces sp. NBC_01335]|uniref:ferredoxin n=1 Tax=Streptomyces sp. NBC_01335 TaxID=2903828 RepID=UPI002E160D83|nr:ferredoxin [Streptomyces sp. NBC_01335]
MRIDIDTDRCIGAARCVQHAPGVFTQDDDGVVELLPDDGGREDGPLIEEAAFACPVQAITLGRS